jgi:hypothetical protein
MEMEESVSHSSSTVENWHIMGYNRSVRRLFNLSYRTHTRFLPYILETPGVLDQIYCRFIKMCQSMQKSENVKVRLQYMYVNS